MTPEGLEPSTNGLKATFAPSPDDDLFTILTYLMDTDPPLGHYVLMCLAKCLWLPYSQIEDYLTGALTAYKAGTPYTFTFESATPVTLPARGRE
ncbi:hypothetical protein ANRL4_01491 [Anaerolineae bacterium]|nr:hypothetical protein ANRL4_01491 [Anaerolineae bacterium]